MARGMNLIVIALATSIPFGLGMFIYTLNSYWLLFCLPILVFL